MSVGDLRVSCAVACYVRRKGRRTEGKVSAETRTRLSLRTEHIYFFRYLRPRSCSAWKCVMLVVDGDNRTMQVFRAIASAASLPQKLFINLETLKDSQRRRSPELLRRNSWRPKASGKERTS